MDEEIWKEIPGWNGEYFASNHGRVKSIDRWIVISGGPGTVRKAHPRLFKGKILNQRPMQYGHMLVTLGTRERQRSVHVHTLVLKTFVGPRPKGTECCHNDGNASNNRLDNLRWASHKENGEDMVRHGRTLRGAKNFNVKLTLEQVVEIKKCLARGQSLSSLGRQFGVGVNAIFSIKKGKSWAYVPDPFKS